MKYLNSDKNIIEMYEVCYYISKIYSKFHLFIDHLHDMENQIWIGLGWNSITTWSFHHEKRILSHHFYLAGYIGYQIKTPFPGSLLE